MNDALPESPRSGRTKATETAIDLTILALAIPLAFDLARAFFDVQIPDGLEAKATAFLVAVGGVVARMARHWWVYVRRQQRESEIERRRRA